MGVQCEADSAQLNSGTLGGKSSPDGVFGDVPKMGVHSKLRTQPERGLSGRLCSVCEAAGEQARMDHDPRDGQGAEVTWPSHLDIEMQKLRPREARRDLPVVIPLDLLPSWGLA